MNACSISTINLEAEKMALIDLINNVNSVSVIKSLKRSFDRTIATALKKDAEEYISKEEILEGIRSALCEVKESQEKGIKLMDAKQLLNEL